MTSRSSPAGYSIYDLLTRIVPGFVFISPGVLYLVIFTSIDLSNFILWIIIGILSLIFGEFTEILRAFLFPIPVAFSQIVYEETDRERTEVLGRLDRLVVRGADLLPDRVTRRLPTGRRGTIFDDSPRDFRETFEDHFHLKMDEAAPASLYFTLISYMEPRLTSSTRRYQMLRTFSLNLLISTTITMLAAIGFISYWHFVDSEAISGELLFIFLMFTVFGPAVLEFVYFFMAASGLFVHHLITEYYIDRIEHIQVDGSEVLERVQKEILSRELE